MVIGDSLLKGTEGPIYSGQALEQAAQGGGGVPIPGGVQKHVDMALQDMV